MNTKYGLMMTMAVMLVALSVVSGWADRTISLGLHNVTIGEALAQLFTKADVDYAVKDGVSGGCVSNLRKRVVSGYPYPETSSTTAEVSGKGFPDTTCPIP